MNIEDAKTGNGFFWGLLNICYAFFTGVRIFVVAGSFKGTIKKNKTKKQANFC